MNKIPESLPQHAFPLQNYQLEKTDVFFRWGQGRNRVEILAAVSDLGITNAVIPILRQLQKAPADIYVIADSLGKEYLINADLGFKPARQNDPFLTMASLQANAAITGFSTDPGSEFALTINAHMNGVPVIWLEDYPGGMVPHYKEVMARNQSLLLPDYVFVSNDWAKQVNLEVLRDFPPERVVVTGQPAFDSITTENLQETRIQVRKRLGISPEDKLIASFLLLPARRHWKS